VVQGFLGNIKESNYKELVQKNAGKFQGLGCNMSTKLHYLHFHIGFFSENLGDISEE